MAKNARIDLRILFRTAYSKEWKRGTKLRVNNERYPEGPRNAIFEIEHLIGPKSETTNRESLGLYETAKLMSCDLREFEQNAAHD
jgi:hypothetical protein